MNAREWLSSYVDGPADIAVLGAPIARASITTSQAQTTPPAFRRALEHLATWDGDHGVEVDATADVAGMTVRAMASVFLAFCAGVATRRGGRRR